MAKVLFISTGFTGLSTVPTAPALFHSILKNAGHTMCLFDTAFYKELSENVIDRREETGEVRETDLAELNSLMIKTGTAKEDLTDLITRFCPDVIMISLTESMYDQVVKILEYTSPYHILTVLGGVFPTVMPEFMLSHTGVDIVCVGEGENAVTELCGRLDKGHDYRDISNLYVKEKNGDVVKNPHLPPVDINTLPVPDYSLFQEYRFYRPMAGTLYKMLTMDTGRGCYYKCSYCSSGVQYGGGPIRMKTVDKIYRDISACVKRHSFNFIFFCTDNFLTISETEFDEFIEMYSSIKLPFFMQTCAETVTENKIKRLRDIGLFRMAFAIEHGNEEFRKKVLNKPIKNNVIERAAEIIHAADLPLGLSVSNMVGLPLENRELAMDTITFNHSIAKYVDGMSCYIFKPFHGTPLRKLAVDMGFLSDATIASGALSDASLLDIPGFNKAEIAGLRKCFSLYTRFDKSRWPEIRQAESDDKLFGKLMEEYRELYF